MIKRISFVALAILLTIGIAFAVTPGYRQDHGVGDILGQGKYQGDPHKIFRMVRYLEPTFGTGTSLNPDAIVIWDLTADDGVTVTTTTTSWDSAVAGIVIATALTQDVDGNTALQDMGKDNWTWLQTYGLSEVTLATGDGTSAGDAFGTSATAGSATRFKGINSLTALPSARKQGNVGFIYDAVGSGATNVQCFLVID